MMDESLDIDHRVLIALRRYAWGNLSDFAVDALPAQRANDSVPRPITQEWLARKLNVSESTISKSVAFWKERGYLREKHPFLFPEDSVNSLDSPEDLESDSDSSKYRSLYLRLESAYLSKDLELAQSITQLANDRKDLQDRAKKDTDQIRKLKAVILAYFRDYKRTGADPKGLFATPVPVPDSAKNPNKTANSKTDDNPMRLCAPAQNETEDKANQGIVSTISNTLESGSHSEPKNFPTPAPWTRKRESDSGEKPNNFPLSGDASLKPLIKILKEESAAAAADPTTEQEPTAPHETPPPAARQVRDYDGKVREMCRMVQIYDPVADADALYLVNLATQYGLDEAGAHRLMLDCRKVRPDATLTEIAHFLEIEAARYQKRGKTIRSLSGLLLTSVPDQFKGRSFEAYRNRQRQAEPEPAGKENSPAPAPTWANQGSWEGDKHHWDELDSEMQKFYREMFPEECPR